MIAPSTATLRKSFNDVVVDCSPVKLNCINWSHQRRTSCISSFMSAIPRTNGASSSSFTRRLPPDTEFVLPEPVAELRSIAHLLHLVDAGDQALFHRILKPSAKYFRGSLFYGGRVQQSNSCAALLLADTTEDYIAQVSPPFTSVQSCLLSSAGKRLCLCLRWNLGHEGWRRGCSLFDGKDAAEEEARGNWHACALAVPPPHRTCTGAKTHHELIALSKVYERLRAVPDTLAAVVVGSIKASSRARQCRSPVPRSPSHAPHRRACFCCRRSRLTTVRQRSCGCRRPAHRASNAMEPRVQLF